jgi:hypothetical protein
MQLRDDCPTCLAVHSTCHFVQMTRFWNRALKKTSCLEPESLSMAPVAPPVSPPAEGTEGDDYAPVAPPVEPEEGDDYAPVAAPVEVDEVGKGKGMMGMMGKGMSKGSKGKGVSKGSKGKGGKGMMGKGGKGMMGKGGKGMMGKGGKGGEYKTLFGNRRAVLR